MASLAAMQVWTVVGTFLVFHSDRGASGLWCYKCSETSRPPPGSQLSNVTQHRPDQHPPPCSKFDPYSAEYQVECKDSTFCMKKTFQLELQNGHDDFRSRFPRPLLKTNAVPSVFEDEPKDSEDVLHSPKAHSTPNHLETVRGMSRGCAPQSYNYHSYSEGVGWTVKKAMEDTAYEDGCTTDSANPSRVKAPSAEHCYCATNLCNSASSSALRGGGSGTKSGGEAAGGRRKGGEAQGLGERVVEAGRRAGEVVGKTVAAAAHHTDAMAVIIVFNAVKYIRSLRGEDIY